MTKLTAYIAAAAMAMTCLLAQGGERYAVIIGAKAGDQSLFDTVKSYCARTQAALIKSGFPQANVKAFAEGGAVSVPGAEEPSADAILAHLEKLSSSVKDGDQLWLFLYGDANINQKGISFATAGKRLRGAQLAEALDKIPGTQFVICMTRQSCGILEPLSKRPRFVASASSDPSQTNPPLLPGFLLDRLEAKPASSLIDSLRDAGDKAKEHYASSGLAIAETSMLFDGERMLPYPFDGSSAQFATMRFAQDRKPELAKESLSNEPEAPPKKEAPEVQPPDESTKALIAKAAEAAKKHAGFPAFVLERSASVSINKDLSTVRTEASSTFLIEDVAAEEFGKASFIDHPPDSELKILKSRIVFPDGSFLDAKPEAPPYDAKKARRLSFVKFPGARAGCLVQIETSTSERPVNAMSFITERVVLQRHIPTDASTIEVAAPLEMELRFKVRNAQAKPEAGPATPYAKTTLFKFGALPAFEPLPGDPPAAECLASLELSTLASWDALSKWAAKVVADNSTADDAAKELAATLTKGLKSDAEKLKALYEFLCELRYETTPVGLRSFRPRTPGEVCSSRYGDCKDKANALVALAREAGIQGCMALLNRGGASDESFPSWQFNHALAFFPKLEGHPDGLWLDATDGATPFGTLPPGDIGRAGFLLVSGKPEFKAVSAPGGAKGLFSETFALKVEGSEASGELSIEASGFMDYMMRQQFKRLTPLQARSEVQRIVDDSFSGLTAGTPSLSPLGDLSKGFKLTAPLKASSWSSAGRRVLPPFRLWGFAADGSRDRPLVLFDGQPAVIRQTVRISGDMSFEKSAELDIAKPVAQPGDEIAKLRETIRDAFIDIK